ncbi:MAG: transporter substrate-binding domain-containing protein [Treponema sp.]|nr:transporter substrate-binding domain-containing protein [Treponema sp.]
MKRIISLVLAVLMLTGMVFLTSCGGKAEGKLICGVTEYEPMNYRNSSGHWTGFDTDLALLVGEKLGMKVEFQEIEWANKYQELEAGTINAIWNGFTANSFENGVPRSAMVDFSYSYMLNQQCIVIRSARANEINSIDSLFGKTVAAESGSAGETAAKEVIGSLGRIVGAPAQINTFLEVKSGAVDFAMVDVLLARRLAGSGDYSDLMIADILLDYEVYAVGFKKGSDLRNKVNNALKELDEEGKLWDLAVKYKLEDTIILDTNFKG